MKIAGVFIATLLFTLIAFSADDIRKTLPASPGQELRIDLKTGGSISITGWEKDSVEVLARLRGKDADEEQVEIEQVPAGVDIRADYARRREHRSSDNDFRINVPLKYDCDIRSFGGEISITGVTGNFDGSTMGGRLELTSLKGTIHLQTMGGNITLTKSELDGSVSTSGGTVLLEDVVGDVEGRSLGGAVTYRNVTNRRGKTTGREVHITTMGGPISVDDAPAGADLSTMGGTIEVHSAGDHVRAKTMGGDITIDTVDGSVDASTLGGNVEVTMTGDPAHGDRDVSISSLGGDIRLTVPAALSMDIDIDIAYSDHHPRIISDFQLTQEERTGIEHGNRNLRKHIHGSGRTGDGKHRIRLTTTEGDVYLTRGS